MVEGPSLTESEPVCPLTFRVDMDGAPEVRFLLSQRDTPWHGSCRGVPWLVPREPSCCSHCSPSTCHLHTSPHGGHCLRTEVLFPAGRDLPPHLPRDADGHLAGPPGHQAVDGFNFPGLQPWLVPSLPYPCSPRSPNSPLSSSLFFSGAGVPPRGWPCAGPSVLPFPCAGAAHLSSSRTNDDLLASSLPQTDIFLTATCWVPAPVCQARRRLCLFSFLPPFLRVF